MSALSLSWQALLWCLLPLLSVILIHLVWLKQDVFELLYASFRMLIQLVIVGYCLVWLFDNPNFGIALAIAVFMLVASVWIAIRPLQSSLLSHRATMFCVAAGLSVSVMSHLVVTLWLILPVEPWYTPSVMIPLMGMYFANTMNSISLAGERYFAEREQGVDPPVAKRQAYKTAMIPQINGLLAVGLVALPGMMTGQVLAGVDPLVAVRYQILIMVMILGTSGSGAAVMLSCLEKKESRKTTLE